jgi:hypothetical protein
MAIESADFPEPGVTSVRPAGGRHGAQLRPGQAPAAEAIASDGPAGAVL